MSVYSVMLEGRENQKGFLITIDVAGSSQASAKSLALAEASRRGLQIIGVEEVSRKAKSAGSATPEVIKVYGKSYFDLEGSE